MTAIDMPLLHKLFHGPERPDPTRAARPFAELVSAPGPSSMVSGVAVAAPLTVSFPPPMKSLTSERAVPPDLRPVVAAFAVGGVCAVAVAPDDKIGTAA